MIDSPLFAGFSSAPITTRGDLIGWGKERLPCSGINDPLMVSSLVLEENGSRIALITLDLLAIDFAEADAIRSRMAGVGVRPEDVLIAASHTHSGPASIDVCSIQKNKELANEVADRAEQCVREAVNSLTRASIRTAFTEFSGSANRRQRKWLRRTVLGVNLRGPVDHQLSCVGLENIHGKVLLVSYGCHPVINATSLESADYVAGIRQAAVSAGFSHSLFLPGALGDVDPYDRQNHRTLVGAGIGTAFDFGNRLGRDALTALAQGKNDPTAKLSSASVTREVFLPMLNGGRLSRQLLVQTFRIGQLVLIAFPGEIFAQTSLDLKEKTGVSNLTIVSCANGYIGYVPPKAEYPRGGYEIEEVPRLLGYRVPAGTAEDFQRIAENLVASRLQNNS